MRKNSDTTTPMGRKNWYPLIGGNYELRNNSRVVQKRSNSSMYGHLRSDLLTAYVELSTKLAH